MLKPEGPWGKERSVCACEVVAAEVRFCLYECVSCGVDLRWLFAIFRIYGFMKCVICGRC